MNEEFQDIVAGLIIDNMVEFADKWAIEHLGIMYNALSPIEREALHVGTATGVAAALAYLHKAGLDKQD